MGRVTPSGTLMKVKLQTKITLIYSLIFTMVLVAMNGAVFLTIRFYNQSNDNIQLQRTRSLVESVLRETGTFTTADLQANGIGFPLVLQIRSDHLTFNSTDRLKIIEGQKYSHLEFDYLGERVSHRATVIHTEFIGPAQVSYSLTIAKSIEENSYNQRVTIVTLVIASFLGMLLSLAVGSYMSHESFKPINNMRRSVESIDAENLQDRIRVPNTNDELTELGNTFNSLLDRMETAYAKQSKFVSDASHELRTPLTVVKGYVELLDRWGKDDPEILDEAITAIKEETYNMNNLVENLLFIAKGENRKLNVVPEFFDLLKLVEEVAEETRMTQPVRQIEFQGKSLSIEADRKMLKQLLRVFIENSVKFTPEDGTIRIVLQQEKDKAIIKVWDNGEGIAEEDLKQVFERFYVADKARTKDKSGSGLGLSIAKWIVDVHKGTLQLDSKVGEFTEFTVTLPLMFNGDFKSVASGEPASYK